MELAALIVSICGVIVTGVFSFLIWQANKQSAIAAKEATNAAIESARISQSMLEMQEEQKESIRNQLKRDITTQVYFIERNLNTMVSTGKYSSEIMSRLPEKINITNLELANYFSEDERALIYKARSKFENYRNDYFTNGKPDYAIDEEFIQTTKDLLDLTKDVVILLTDHYIIRN
ncbi:hypothetical protein [Metabacillus fastidiosus]|uniref:hypothetical protein n=1 Tax=Metabacillus fastidiosus TaxID=1458 RepID=UPI002DB590AF|nr:hypothetical protein [Metabacillus fastidiosus]MEC2074574.1 hypothetical protein [Metabacillus fastidiosus]